MTVGQQLSFVRAADLPTFDEYWSIAQTLLQDAGYPYFRALFGSDDAVASVLNSWLRRPSSELSILRMQFLASEASIAGGFLALDASELQRARKADTIALVNSVRTQDRVELHRRLANLSSVFSPVNEREYYLSKVALMPQFRGRRLAHVLLERFIEDGANRGLTQFRLDVDVDNEAAIRSYRSAGFEISARGGSQDGSVQYYSMRYELSQP